MIEDEDLSDEIDEPQDVEVLDRLSEQPSEGADALVASSSALSRRDPLRTYMRDVQRYSLL